MKRPRVLVVDDEQAIRDLLRDFFTREGYEVVAAASGKEGIELAREKSPDVILLDVSMPGIDGIETCKILKMDEKAWTIPVIIMSAFGHKGLEGKDVGAEDVVVKPFTLDEVLLRVKSIIAVRHLTDPVERLIVYMEELDKKQPKANDGISR